MSTSKILSNLSRWPLFLTFTFYVYLSHVLSPDRLPVGVYINDKVLHFLNFLTLALLGYRTFSRSSGNFFSRHAEQKAMAFALLYGALMEMIQSALPARQASFLDWSADAAGVFLSFVIFRISKLTPPT